MSTSLFVRFDAAIGRALPGVSLPVRTDLNRNAGEARCEERPARRL